MTPTKTERKLILKQIINQSILEHCADLLDEENLIFHQLELGISDPENREDSELHIRMADAAWKEYEKTMFSESDQTKIQPTEIEQLIKEKLADRKIDDEFGWTGEWRMSAKNVLDLIIDLQNNPNSQTQIEKMEDDKAELIENHFKLFRRLNSLVNRYKLSGFDDLLEKSKEINRKHSEGGLNIVQSNP